MSSPNPSSDPQTASAVAEELAFRLSLVRLLTEPHRAPVAPASDATRQLEEMAGQAASATG